MEKPTKPKAKTATRSSSSALVYVVVVFLVATLMNLIAFQLFWNSETRELAVQIQAATDDSLENPFFLPIDDSAINVDDKILSSDELHFIKQLILDRQAHFNLDTDFEFIKRQEILKLLEF